MLTIDLPFVSVIIPAKNEAKILGKCLDSLFRLDYPGEKLEIIVIDNGSVDDTVRIAEESGAVVYICPELTIAGMRNYGARLAHGDVVAFVDADVLVGKDWLTSAIPILFEEGVGCVGCSPEIPENAGWVERMWHMQIDVKPQRFEKSWIASMNMIVRKQAFEEIGGFNEKLRTCEDVDFCYRLHKQWKIVYARSIVAVHYGEAKSVIQLFKKESWRGISNFDGIKSHGFNFKELPSHAIALNYCCALLVLPFSPLLDYRLIYLIAFMSIIPPTLISTGIVKKNRKYSSLLPLMSLWTVYCFARGWSLVRYAFKIYNR